MSELEDSFVELIQNVSCKKKKMGNMRNKTHDEQREKGLIYIQSEFQRREIVKQSKFNE